MDGSRPDEEAQDDPPLCQGRNRAPAYAAPDLTTALWEAGLCTNDVTQPGTFYISDDVAKKGLIAVFTLQADITVLDLNASVLSKLGIYDEIHGDHAWCQW